MWYHKTFMQIKVEVNDLCENLPLNVMSGSCQVNPSVLPFAENGDVKVSNILLPLHVTHCIF